MEVIFVRNNSCTDTAKLIYLRKLLVFLVARGGLFNELSPTFG